VSISRRELLAMMSVAWVEGRVLSATSESHAAVVNVVNEWSFESRKTYRDPFNEVELDVDFTGRDGAGFRIPAFWAGELTWRVRFAPPTPGLYQYQTRCSDTRNADLHGRAGPFQAVAYEGQNPLLRHGAIRVAKAGQYFEHADGTPFFFLADDWWHGMSKRLRWPKEFRALVEDRAQEGFTVIKMVPGLACDTPEFDPRNENEAGLPWEEGYARIRPKYFDAADLRVQHLVERGLVPAIVGAWGYYLLSMGVQKMQQHWRYLVARWGAYPVVWYLSLENDMPYYLSMLMNRWEDEVKLRAQWTEVGRYLKTIDPFRRPITMQSMSGKMTSRDGLLDASLLDFDSLHVGHSDRASVLRGLEMLCAGRSRQPTMPVLPGEICFEGIGGENWQNIQRMSFWGNLLSGAAGYCYGANGVWQFNRREEPFGVSPFGATWGGEPWEVAAQYPGSHQIGLAKKFLSRYAYWRMEPHPEWIDPHPDSKSILPPYAAGVPREFRIAYLSYFFPFREGKPVLKQLEPDVRYKARWFDPVLGGEYEIGPVETGPDGVWAIPPMPAVQDWVIVLERA